MTALGPGEPGLVSVVVPVYNGARWVGEAIESVLSQDYAPIEVIAIDDGSTDDSARILAGYPELKVIRQSNSGCTGARNRGIAESRGELIAFIDQDDHWRPGKLRRQVEALAAQPEAGYSLGMLELFLEPGCPIPAWMGQRGWLMGTARVGYMPGTLVVRRATFDAIGVFDERYVVGSDADWLVRARDADVGLALVNEVILDKRIHENNLSSHPSGSTDMLSVLAESLRRRRAGTAD